MTDIFHHENLYRGKPVRDLFAKHITVCGAGALGSNLIDNLTRQGFSRLRAIDKDRVELHNINNQCYAHSHVGGLKTAAIHSVVFNAVGIEIETEHKELSGGNVKKLLRGTDLVVDCFDNSASRRTLTDFCLANNIPCLHVGLNADFAEVVWNERYVVPNDVVDKNGNSCDNPLARNVVILAVVAATEEIVNFHLDRPKRRLYISLVDLQIRKT